MSGSTTEFHKIWIDQCAAAKDIRDQFGPKDALGYLIFEKLFTFLWAAERDPLFAAEVPDFIREIRRIFAAVEISDYLDLLENTKYLASPDAELELDDLDEDEPLLENPVMGAEELLRFSRIRQLLQVQRAMAKPKRDPIREERINEEIIVDGYGSDEQAIGWYYYLEDKIHFPFQAKCSPPK